MHVAQALSHEVNGPGYIERASRGGASTHAPQVPGAPADQRKRRNTGSKGSGEQRTAKRPSGGGIMRFLG